MFRPNSVWPVAECAAVDHQGRTAADLGDVVDHIAQHQKSGRHAGAVGHRLQLGQTVSGNLPSQQIAERAQDRPGAAEPEACHDRVLLRGDVPQRTGQQRSELLAHLVGRPADRGHGNVANQFQRAFAVRAGRELERLARRGNRGQSADQCQPADRASPAVENSFAVPSVANHQIALPFFAGLVHAVRLPSSNSLPQAARAGDWWPGQWPTKLSVPPSRRNSGEKKDFQFCHVPLRAMLPWAPAGSRHGGLADGSASGRSRCSPPAP